jgi:hypothetical protein
MPRIFFFVSCMFLGLAWQHTEAYAASADAVIVPQDQIEVVSATSGIEGAEAVLDGDKGTAWTVSGPFPQELVLKLPDNNLVTAIKYTHANKTDYLNQYLSIRSIRFQFPEFQAAGREWSPIPAVVGYLPVTLTRV